MSVVFALTVRFVILKLTRWINVSIIYLINEQPHYVRFSHIKTILGHEMKISMITVTKRTVVMIIGDIKMIGTIIDAMTVMIKDKMLITRIFLR